ncbi:MAG: (Fe-S)-binding protein [Candidatus Thorarchaeota archaeon]
MKKYTADGFTFTITEVKPCLADEQRIRIIANFEADLTPILEVLFLHLRNANYSRSLSCVTTKRAGHSTTVFGSGKVAMTFLKDEAEALNQLMTLAKTLTRAFAYLDANGPPDSDVVHAKENINTLQIHKLLPQTDCGDCGKSGCFAFATLLMNGERDIADCELLECAEYSDKRNALVKVIQPINLDMRRDDRSDLAEFLGLKSWG